jgi:hypothetical protein
MQGGGDEMAKRDVRLSGIRDAFVGGFFVWFVDKVLLIDKWTEHQSIVLRLFLVAIGILAVFFGRRYYLILGGGGERSGSERRAQFDDLHHRLADGGTPAIVYNRWLKFALGKVDYFFSDAGRNDKSWIARLLYLETHGPRWTAPAFDRCLLLALVYPCIAIFVTWALSGHVGVAERALLLEPDDPTAHYPALGRSLSFFSLLFALYFIYRGRSDYRWFALAAFFTVAFEINSGTAGLLGVAGLFGYMIFKLAEGTNSGLNRIQTDVGFGAFSVALAITGANWVAFPDPTTNATNAPNFIYGIEEIGSLTTAILLAVAVKIACMFAYRKGQYGPFLTIFSVIACISCFLCSYSFATLTLWPKIGDLLLFFGLLTLINAPVDWLAVGFTRALLRRGLARGGWWPFYYALIDIVVASVLVATLAFAMVLAVQTFDDIAVLRAGPGARILPLQPLLDGLARLPKAYENWWVWILLFSSMIPSILNLSIAIASFLRGLPILNQWILSRITLEKPLRERDRILLTATLTTQIVGGVLLTGVAIYLFLTYLIPLGLPAFGTLMRDFAADLASYNAPARAIIWLAR